MNDQGPIGKGDFLVAAGDCVDSIAFEYGHFWETIWNHPANAELKKVRKDPNVLRAGDRLTIPELREEEVTRGPKKRHRFRRRGVPAKLRLRFLRFGEPRAGLDYSVNIDGTRQEGKLDRDGRLEIWIPPSARSAKLTLRDGSQDQEFDLGLGHLDPIDTVSGVQARLAGLGYDCEVSGTLDEATRRALRNFQSVQDLKSSGDLDQVTRDELKRAFGS